ncbi:MAG: hypothetical protein ACRC6Z_04160 [Cetobacterium sp.]
MKKKKMAIFLLIAVCFICLPKELMSQESNLGYDEAYIEIKSKVLKDDFFMVRYDYENDDIFIPIKGLFYFLEIYSIDVNLNKKIIDYRVDGNKTRVEIKTGKTFVLDEELYVNLEGLEKSFDFGSLKWSGQDLRLNLNPNFILPFEIREKGKVERIRLSDKQEKSKFNLIQPDKKKIAPGLLKISYSTNDIENINNQIGLEYGTQFFYGDFYIDYDLELSEIKSTNLTYNNFYKENDLVIGDFYIKTPDFLNVNSSVRGFSLGEKNTFSSTSGNVTTIKGETQGADVIELYQNGILLDYQKSTEKKFIFEVRDRNYGGDYSLKIYYENGQIETRKVYTVGNSKLLNKNEWSYNIQVGEERENKKIQSVNEVNYGVDKNLTIGLGVLELESNRDREYNIFKSEMIYRVGFSNYPLIINFNNFYEYEKKESSYELKVNQKIKNYNLTFENYKYSDYIAAEDGTKDYKSIGITRSFINTRVGIGYQQEQEYLTLKQQKGYYISLENRSLRNLSFFLDTEINYDENNTESLSINPGISYGGINNFTTLLQANINKREKVETNYSLKILGKRKRIRDSSAEYVMSGEVKYSEEEKFRFSLDFTVYLENYLYLEVPMSLRDDETLSVGLSAEKVIDLSDLKRDVKDRQVDNSWIFGKVYIDSNNNGSYDIDETTLSDVTIIVDGKKVDSDINGDYFIPGLLPLENYQVLIDRKSIDPMLTQVVDKKKVGTRASVGTRYDIGVQAVSMVTGNILPSDNVSSEELIRILSMTTVDLEKDNESYLSIDPEFDGMYFFENVLPGKYKLKFVYLGSDKVTFSEEGLEVDVALEKEDEGQYFEGYDVVVDKEDVEKTEKVIPEDLKEDNYNIEDILNNF